MDQKNTFEQSHFQNYSNLGQRKFIEAAPPPRPGEWEQSPTLPLPLPKNRGELDRFLKSLSVVAVQDVEAIRKMFAEFEEREALAAVFHEALHDRPCGDIGRFMLLLSTVGELAHPSSLDVLYELVWTSDVDLMKLDSSDSELESSHCMFPSSGMIQSRAVEMFAWIAAGRHDDRLLDVVANHPAIATRLAAADSYLFAHHDSPEALQYVLNIAREEDRKGIGVPRFSKDSDRDVFYRAVEQAQSEQAVKIPEMMSIRSRLNKNTKEEM